MGYFRSAPTYDQAILAGDKTSSSWYRWFQSLELGEPPSSESVITVGPSPFIYSSPRAGGVVVSGGTISSISISRSGAFYPTGQTQGLFQLAANDKLQIIYSGIPSMVILPS